MARYLVQVTELVANIYTYAVDASDEVEALEKASNGETESAEFLETVGVVDRTDCVVVETP